MITFRRIICIVLAVTILVSPLAAMSEYQAMLLKKFGELYLQGDVSLRTYAILMNFSGPADLACFKIIRDGNTWTYMYQCGCGYRATFIVIGSDTCPLFGVQFWCPHCTRSSAMCIPERGTSE